MHNEERFFPLEANMMMDLTGHANDCCAATQCAPGEKLLMLTRCHISAGMEGKAAKRPRAKKKQTLVFCALRHICIYSFRYVYGLLVVISRWIFLKAEFTYHLTRP